MLTPSRLRVGALTLIRYDESATRDLYRVRNHPTVRQFMAQPRLIPYREHVDWTRRHLLGSRSLLLWLVRPSPDARAIGLTQLKLTADRGTAEIGVIFREPELHRLPAAIASALTLHIAFERLPLERVVSYVVASHAYALEYNQAWGLQIAEPDRPGLVRLVLDRDRCLSNPHYRRVMARIVRGSFVIEP